MRGVRGQAPLGGQHPPDPLGAGVQYVGDAVELGDPVPLVPGARVARPEPLRRLGEVGERGGQPVRLAYGEQDGRHDGQQRHRADHREGPPDLLGDRGAGLLDGDDLALFAAGAAADDALGDRGAHLHGPLAGDGDAGVVAGVQLLGEGDRVDRLVLQDVRLDDAHQSQRLGLDAVLGAAGDGPGLHDDEGDAEDGDHDEHHGERGVDEAAAHALEHALAPVRGGPERAGAQLFSKRKPTPRTVAM